MKLEHIAPYLPYLVLTKRHYDVIGNSTEPLTISNISELTSGYKDKFTRKPILRPLSDLTDHAAKVWGHGGAKHSPLHYLLKDIEERNVAVHIWNELLEGHYDVFGLIDKGQAIDVNTITQQEVENE